MKKILSIFLCFVLLFSAVACSSSTSTGNKESKSHESISTENKESKSTESISTENKENKTIESTSEIETDTAETKTAVVCFSATGNTMAIAEKIADVTGGNLFEIIPAEKYTDEDLNYNDDNCRANEEQGDSDTRPAIENDLSAVEEYDEIYLGYPIWWGTNPRIIQTFLDTYNLADATIYTFCTSGGSGIEESITDLQTLYPDLQIVTGKRLNDASEEDVDEWISSVAQ